MSGAFGGHGNAPGGYGGGHGGPAGYGGYGGPPPGHGAPGGPMGHVGFGHGAGVEFGPAENEVIGATGSWARVLGVVRIVEGVIALLSLNIVGAGVGIGIGSAFHRGGAHLRNVTQTQGHDVHHLVTALSQFGGAFLIRIVLTLVAMGLVLLLGVMFAVVSLTVG